jgi:hypothetical protein
MRPKGQRPTEEPLAGSVYTMPLGYDRVNDGHKAWQRSLDGLQSAAFVSPRDTSISAPLECYMCSCSPSCRTGYRF